MSDPTYERVQLALARLKLARWPDCLDHLAEEGAKRGWAYLEFLDQLFTAELAARSERDIAMKTKLAHFPVAKTLEQFDFAYQPSISERHPRPAPASLHHQHPGAELPPTREEESGGLSRPHRADEGGLTARRTSVLGSFLPADFGDSIRRH